MAEVITDTLAVRQSAVISETIDGTPSLSTRTELTFPPALGDLLQTEFGTSILTEDGKSLLFG